MKDSTKLVLVGVGGLAVGYLLFKPKDVGLNASRRPGARMRFAAAPPASMVEGSSGTMSVTVTNTSKQAGVNVPYTFGILARIMVGGSVAYTSGIQSLPLAAGASSPANFSFTLVAGKVGSGYAEVKLISPDGNTEYATTGQFAVTVTAAEVIPAGQIAW